MPDGDDLFAVEAKGLALLRNANAIRVPAEIGHGRQGDLAYLILEYLESDPIGPLGALPVYWETLGHQLAELHAHTQPRFGLDYANFIGTLPQSNTWTVSGYDFFFEHRLLPQAARAPPPVASPAQDPHR